MSYKNPALATPIVKYPVYKIIEAPKASPLPELTTELKESLRALQLHPGFQYLMMRLQLERATIRETLEKGYQIPEGGLRHLQAGVYYTGWLENEIKRLTSVPRGPERTATPDEERLFAEAHSALELIG
jgi:hypothetical protein